MAGEESEAGSELARLIESKKPAAAEGEGQLTSLSRINAIDVIRYA